MLFRTLCLTTYHRRVVPQVLADKTLVARTSPAARVVDVRCRRQALPVAGDPARRDGGLSDADGGDGTWHCFTGTPTNDDQFLNHCTESERVDRASYVPIGTWDPKNPLPQS